MSLDPGLNRQKTNGAASPIETRVDAVEKHSQGLEMGTRLERGNGARQWQLRILLP
jgi:hypothetical protein